VIDAAGCFENVSLEMQAAGAGHARGPAPPKEECYSTNGAAPRGSVLPEDLYCPKTSAARRPVLPEGQCCSKNSGGGIAPAAIGALIEGGLCSVNVFRRRRGRPGIVWRQ